MFRGASTKFKAENPRCPHRISNTSLPRATLDPSTDEGLSGGKDDHPLLMNIDDLHTLRAPETALAGQDMKNKLP